LFASRRLATIEPAGETRRGDSGLKTFKSKREANAFLAAVETALNCGLYVAPDGGRLRLSEYAERWLAARNDEKATAARDAATWRR
jgi:hypothetical protein